MQTILVVDDQSNIRRLLQDYLGEQGFRVVIAENGLQALYTARHEKPDLIILDIMMPEMDGYSFLRTYRKEKETPVVLLTAKVEETDTILGLELGADDYITKPFRMGELLARIRAVLRRANREPLEAEILRVGEVWLDKSAHLVKVNDAPIELTPSEFDLLQVLMTAPGRVYSRMELLERLQGTEFEGLERTIDVHIRNLRTKIEIDPAHPRWIETVYGVGYRFSSEAENMRKIA
jgi:two-component system, OmpR family, alkaline phosphatase synthesis response regulator PhoP